MADHELRDAKNQFIGKIVTQSDGRMVIRNAKNESCGIFDPKTNETRNNKNEFFGKGNLLALLL
ncbi:hypothetical protein MCERE10_02557 [Burkholderiaceae bacterium]